MYCEAVKNSAEGLGFSVYFNEPMSRHTTFCIGGPAELFVECNCVSKLPEFLKAIKQYNLPLFVLGKGSNLLVSDNGVKGVVLYICDDKIDVCGKRIVCNAGVKLSKACVAAKQNSLSGLEFAFGIPGSVGGAVYMNAGAYGGEMKQVISSVTSVTLDGELIKRNADGLGLGYRTSVFKQNNEIILSAELVLETALMNEISDKMDDFLARRKDKQPLEYPSAGSTFKRPEGYFAGALIEQCGLKGYAVGDAMVSEKHAGFVINKGKATAEDTLKLIEHIQNTVLQKTGVSLETEVIICGE